MNPNGAKVHPNSKWFFIWHIDILRDEYLKIYQETRSLMGDWYDLKWFKLDVSYELKFADASPAQWVAAAQRFLNVTEIEAELAAIEKNAERAL